MVYAGVRYATEWFMTMFARGFSFDLVTRVMDVFSLEGYKIVYRVCLALLKVRNAECDVLVLHWINVL